jgi:histidinol-phosphate/aromatic aminotransferase/cobyric acid decarboxylase-like protein
MVAPYAHVGDLVELDPATLTEMMGLAQKVVRALRRAVNPEMLTRYPEYDEGRRTLAAYFGVAPEELVLTNGTVRLDNEDAGAQGPRFFIVAEPR